MSSARGRQRGDGVFFVPAKVVFGGVSVKKKNYVTLSFII